MLNNIKIKKGYVLGLFLSFLILSFIFINLAAGLLFRNYKTDFTMHKKYTLSQSSLDIIQDIKTPIFIKVYLSSNMVAEYPQYADYSKFVLRFLHKYQALSEGMVQVEVKNPEPYTNLEKEAKTAKIKPILDNNGQSNLYFGAVIGNDAGDSYTIANFVPERSYKLESDISRILAKINNPQRKTIGFISPNLPIINKKYGTTKVNDWAFLTQIKNNYNLVELSDRTYQIPLNIDVLLIVNPQTLSDVFAYSLDQFVLRGGKVLMFIDPYSEKEGEIRGTANISEPQFLAFLKSWGIGYKKDLIVGDADLSETAMINAQMKNYYPWIQIPQTFINQDNAITKELSNISLRSAGLLEAFPNEDIVITPLLSTSENGGSVAAHIAKFSDKNDVLTLYQNDNQKHVLAYLVEGRFSSFFNNNILGDTSYAQYMLPYLAVSANPSSIIVVSDTDMLTDEIWTDKDYIEDNEVYGLLSTSDNGDFVLRAIDYLTQNNQLLGIHNKNGLAKEKTVGEQIYAQVLSKHAEEYNNSKQNLALKEKDLSEIISSIENQNLSPSIKVIEQTEKLRKDINAEQEKIRYYEYVIKQENENRVGLIVVVNTIVIPLFIILFIWFFNLLCIKRRKHQVTELLNEYTNS